MRKIFILLVIILGIFGCTPTKTVRDIDDTASVSAMHFTSENHHYILFTIDGSRGGIVHDPDCWCMIDYD